MQASKSQRSAVPAQPPAGGLVEQQQRDVAFSILSIFSTTLNSLWLVAADIVDH
jgi:hypothetical protein